MVQQTWVEVAVVQPSYFSSYLSTAYLPLRGRVLGTEVPAVLWTGEPGNWERPGKETP